MGDLGEPPAQAMPDADGAGTEAGGPATGTDAEGPATGPGTGGTNGISATPSVTEFAGLPGIYGMAGFPGYTNNPLLLSPSLTSFSSGPSARSPSSSHRSWRAGQEWQAAQATFLVLAGAGILTLLIAGLLLGLGLAQTIWSSAALTLILPTCVGLVGAGFGLAALYTRSQARGKYVTRMEQESRAAIDEQFRALTTAAETATDREDADELKTLMTLNRTQMAGYQDLTRGQASTSYRWSQAALGVGLAVLVVGIVITLLASGTTSKTAVAGLTAIAGALSSYVARTYLRIYERTLQQLNFYFQQPLVTSYLLTAERLAEKMKNADQRDALLASVIAETLTASNSRVGVEGDFGNATPNAPKRRVGRSKQTAPDPSAAGDA